MIRSENKISDKLTHENSGYKAMKEEWPHKDLGNLIGTKFPAEKLHHRCPA